MSTHIHTSRAAPPRHLSNQPTNVPYLEKISIVDFIDVEWLQLQPAKPRPHVRTRYEYRNFIAMRDYE